MTRPHLLYLAWGFPPAAKSCTYRMLAMANSFHRHGWRVTVLTLTEDAWLREHGLDTSLSALVEPEIEVLRVPLYRDDLDTDIRRYSRFRATRPRDWLRWHRRMDERSFPEPVFGRWRDTLVDTVRAVHDRDPVDLLLTSAAPYTFFAPALDLHERSGVPFVLDYRDAWAIDIVGDRPAHAPDSRRGRIEAELVGAAHEVWFVNTPIRDAYAALFPDRADRLKVVRNGSDIALGTGRIPVHQPDPEAGLVFGYLGTITFDARRTRALCEGWRLARQSDPLLAGSRLELRGHLGAGAARGVSGHARIIAEYAQDGISYGGPVAKGDTAAVYAGWDALVLSLVGGRYVTSGKVYDYISTGLPVMSVHEWDHAATEVLEGYPLWVRNQGLEAQDLAHAFAQTAALCRSATDDERAAARAHAESFERHAQLEPPVGRLSEQFGAVARTATGADPVIEPHEAPVPVPAARGRRVVLVHTAPLLDVARRAVESMRAEGAHVTLIGPDGPDASPEVDRRVVVRRLLAAGTGRAAGPRRLPQLAGRAAGRASQKALGAPVLWWQSIRLDGAAKTALSGADVLVALDANAVLTVWQAARRQPEAVAVNGVGPTMELLGLTL